MKKIIYICNIILFMFIVSSCKEEIKQESNNPIIEEEIIEDTIIKDIYFVKDNLKVGTSKYYYTNIMGLSSKILEEELVISKSYLEQGNKTVANSGVMEQIDFITIHYTGNIDKGANAKKHAQYFVNSKNVSIHYIVGNDGIYQTLNDNIMAWHAGASSNITWTKTNVKAESSKRPIFGISKNSYFTINGTETNIKVPYEKNYGYVTNSRYLNPYGISYQIIDGYYYLGSTRWIYTQVKEGRICSSGGNNNSIGIETCVDEGSNLWYTWQLTSKLVANLLHKYNLDISRVVPHQIFTSKNCPQPLIDNNYELWNEFIKLVELEYNHIKQL